MTPDQVRSAGLVRGALPIAPSAGNLRFNDRTPTVATRGFASSRFVTRSPSGAASAVNQIPFSQQRQAIQQSAQRYSQSVAGAGRQMQTAQRPNSAGASSWDRFGNPGRASTATVSPSNQFRQAGNTASTVPGWSRFGSPSQLNRGGSTAPASGGGVGGGGYPHFGATNEPARTSGYGQGSAQSLRLAPSMVHNRAYDAPSNSGLGERQPAYNSPARSYPAPAYSAPSYSAPGNYNSPAYSAPRSSAPGSAPRPSGGGSTRSAPASSGGGHSSGGGGSKSSGGGGHSR